MKVLLIDNFDSFVYNLAQYVGSLGAEPVVVRSDADVADLEKIPAERVVVSPGPGRPEDAGCSIEAILRLGRRVPVLGVCLGHQAIGAAFGARIVRAKSVMHGKTSRIRHDDSGVFAGLPDDLIATRYHSLVIDPQTMPETLEVSAQAEDGTIMGVRHRDLPIEGVQFHPESVLTYAGLDLIENFLR